MPEYKHVKNGHEFSLDKTLPTLKGGYYPQRRGIATLTTNITKDPMAAKGHLRHSSVSTTLNHYVKDVPEVTLNAMNKVEELFSEGAVNVQ